jgi:hypothetical protein
MTHRTPRVTRGEPALAAWAWSESCCCWSTRLPTFADERQRVKAAATGSAPTLIGADAECE